MDRVCEVPTCSNSGLLLVAGQMLCREHFISTSYERIELWKENLRSKEKWGPIPASAIEQTVVEIAARATDLSLNSPDLSKIEKAQLLDILQTLEDLSRRLRRWPRKRVSMRIRIRHDAAGQAWTEDATTDEISMRGMSLECRLPLNASETVVVDRLDTGQQAKGRIAWVRNKVDGSRKIGIELLECENFWGPLV